MIHVDPLAFQIHKHKATFGLRLEKKNKISGTKLGKGAPISQPSKCQKQEHLFVTAARTLEDLKASLGRPASLTSEV